MINLIVAVDKNNGIGRGNTLPWKLPEDLKYFKKTTMGWPVVMGRKTFESIGKPLPGRQNIIITRNSDLNIDGCTIFNDPSALNLMSHSMFVIGGAEIYNSVYDYADYLYLTYIDEEFECDAYFNWNQNDWELVSEEIGLKDEKNPYDYFFRIYKRKQ